MFSLNFFLATMESVSLNLPLRQILSSPLNGLARVTNVATSRQRISLCFIFKIYITENHMKKLLYAICCQCQPLCSPLDPALAP
jgi:hypothetical protein